MRSHIEHYQVKKSGLFLDSWAVLCVNYSITGQQSVSSVYQENIVIISLICSVAPELLSVEL